VESIGFEGNEYDYEDSDRSIVGSRVSTSTLQLYQVGWGDNMKGRRTFRTAIRRYLSKQVGRKWDDVYSELSFNCDQRTYRSTQLFECINSDVCTNIGVHDDKLYVYDSHYIHPIEQYAWIRWYVDPRDGILYDRPYFRNPYKARYKKERALKKLELANNVRIVDKYTEYHLIDNIWFKIKFEYNTLSPSVQKRYLPRLNEYQEYIIWKYPYRYDVLTGSDSSKRTAVAKLTAPKKDIKKFKLCKLVLAEEVVTP
jgi:hypothetical protein